VRDYVVSVVIGLLDGVTDFIPVSSGAHLRIAEALLQIRLSGTFWALYLILAHLGAVSAVLLLYAQQLRAADRMSDNAAKAGRGLVTTSPLTIGIAFLTGSLCRYAICYLTNRAEAGLSALGAALVAGGAAMWMSDVLADGKAVRKRPTLTGALLIGVCDSIGAIFPGFSHAMLTITSGELAGLTRLSAVEFSFLLFVPNMLMESFSEMYSIARAGKNTELAVPHEVAMLAIGFCTSAAGAYFAAVWMLKRSQTQSLLGPALYRICLGLILIVWMSR